MDLHPKLIDLSLGRIETLLARLGNPEKHLPPVVHVAGTNGKGSTIAMMRAALEAAGRRVHVYTSPHLVRFHERIRVTGELIAEDELTALLEECEEANRGEPITFFEITTVAAFLAFSRTPADIVLLETGLGGRLDATNLIEKPRLTIITPVSLDHQQFLGETLGAIAAEKAGILKRGVPCVMARQAPQARAVILETARTVKSPVIEQGPDWKIASRGGNLIFDDALGRRLFPSPALAGPHQVENAGLAIAALGRLGELSPRPKFVAQGLCDVAWPGRLQRLTRGPLVQALPEDWELWLDGGHNPAAGANLAAFAGSEWKDCPLHLVSGMMNSKEAGGFLAPLAGVAETTACIAIPNEANSFSAKALAAMIDARPMPSAADAINAIVRENTAPARILICGSLYLAGTILADNA
jgi:dihydrofolate synthase / folylpolyglutamate synthase